MQYFLYFIPLHTFPSETVKLNKDIFVFASNRQSGIKGVYNNCLCLGISQKSTEKERMKMLKEFIVAINIFRSEWVAIQWLSTLQINSGELVKNIQEAKKKYLSSKDLNRHNDEFVDLKVHSIVLKSYSRSLITVFNKLLKLEITNFIYQGVHYLSSIDAMKMTINRVFGNALLEQTLLFQLFEAIMTNYEDPSIRNKVACEKCGSQRGGSISQRIDIFLKENPELVPYFKRGALSRHKFSHALAGRSLLDYHKPLSKNDKTATEINAYDLKGGDGVIYSVHFIRAYLTIFLIEKLLSK